MTVIVVNYETGERLKLSVTELREYLDTQGFLNTGSLYARLLKQKLVILPGVLELVLITPS